MEKILTLMFLTTFDLDEEELKIHIYCQLACMKNFEDKFSFQLLYL